MKHESLWRNVWTAMALAWLLCWATTAAAQDPPGGTGGPPPDKPATQKAETPKKPRGRLPAYYGRVVDAQQRERIYEIQARFNEQIEKLKEQLEELVEQRDSEVEEVLTDEQRDEVDALKRARRARRTGKSSSDSTTDEGDSM